MTTPQSPEAVAAFAIATVTRLQPHCTAIEIAGRLRLGLDPVGGFEIVCAPRIDVIPGETEGDSAEVIPLREELRSMLNDGWAWDQANHHNSPIYKRLIRRESGIALDLFTANADSFPGLLMYRTGPLNFVEAFGRILERRGMSMTNGIIHRHPVNKRGERPVPCPSGAKCQGAMPVKTEGRLFGIIELPHIPPHERGEWAKRPIHEQR